MSPEEIRGWAAIVLGALAMIGVAVISARSAWRNSRRSSNEAVELRTWPTYGELVTENRNLRTELDELREKFEGLSEQVREVKTHQAHSDEREKVAIQYLAALREHILRELPPPPPRIPDVLSELFADFEATLPRGSA